MVKLNSNYTIEAIRKNISKEIYDEILFAIEENQSLYIYEKENIYKNKILHAIGNYKKEYPTKLLYITGKEFIEDYNNLKKQEWNKKYNKIMDLLVEDIEYIDESNEEIKNCFLKLLEENEYLHLYVTCNKEQIDLNNNFYPGLGINTDITL